MSSDPSPPDTSTSLFLTRHLQRMLPRFQALWCQSSLVLAASCQDAQSQVPKLLSSPVLGEM